MPQRVYQASLVIADESGDLMQIEFAYTIDRQFVSCVANPQSDHPQNVPTHLGVNPFLHGLMMASFGVQQGAVVVYAGGSQTTPGSG